MGILKNHMRVSAFVVISINLACVAAATDHQSSKCECDDTLINRRGFPQGFIFGSASAAYQVEGAYKENGKGPTMWDHFTHTYPDKILDRSNGNVAIDSYNLYKKDVQIAKDLGIDAYRFSISWPRILPGGRRDNGVNQDGIDYYNNLINELLAIGVEPFVTIFHFDTPQALEDAYGGFLSNQIVTDFKDFAEVLFENFGDRVKYWITINEPWCVSNLGYALGVYAPGRCSDWLGNDCVGGDSATEPYIVTHNQILAHAAVVNLYRNKYQKLQKGKIGIAINTYWFEPYDESNENLEARDRALDFMFAWIMEPLAFGRYPYSMRTRVGSRLPEFSKEEAGMVKGSFDFIGLNYYSGMYAKNMPNSTNLSFTSDSGATVSGYRNGIPIGEQGSNLSQYFTYPKGLREILRLIKQKYNDPLIYITENGIDEARNDSISIAEAIKDVKRKNFFHDHLCCLHQAIEKDDASVKGYFVWSMVDNFEWSSGYSVRFGIYYVDFNDKSLTRYPKDSALWFKRILAESIRQPESVISDH